MAHPEPLDPAEVRVVTLTVSDTRTEADDVGGRALVEGLRAAGYRCVRHLRVPDTAAQIRQAVTSAIDSGEADAVVSTGGTGIAPRDVTFEAVSGLLEKALDGFGEAFRRLSWEQVGPKAVLSRAVAGTYRGGVVIALPGSPKAVTLGVEALVVPLLAHAVALLRGARP